MQASPLLIALTAGLAGCASPLATAVVIGVLAQDAMDHYGGRDGQRSMYRAPEPDPARTINVQDCTMPVDYSAGNLLCR